jgi:hypothetical protein
LDSNNTGIGRQINTKVFDQSIDQSINELYYYELILVKYSDDKNNDGVVTTASIPDTDETVPGFAFF